MARSAATRLAVPLAALLVMAATLAAGVIASQVLPIPRRAAALEVLPASTQAVNVTGWRAIRATVHGRGWVFTAGQRDLTSRSTLAFNVDALSALLGFRVTDVDWEVSGTTDRGDVYVLPVPNTDEVADALRAAGFTGHAERLTADDQVLIDAGLADVRQLREVALRDGLLLAADSPGALDQLIRVHEHRAPSLAATVAADVVRALGAAPTVALERGATACAAADPRNDGPELTGQVAEALARAGRLARYSWQGRALRDGGSTFTLALAFESAAVAARQSAVRERLAHGPFIGRLGQVEDDLQIRSATWQGRVARLEFERDPRKSVVVMPGTGPMIFAAC